MLFFSPFPYKQEIQCLKSSCSPCLQNICTRPIACLQWRDLGVRIETVAEWSFWEKVFWLLWTCYNPRTIKFLLVLIAGKNKGNFPPKMWHKGRLERKLLVLPNLPTHSSQSKTYGNPFLQPGSPVLQVQMRSSQDHRFFCKEKHHRLQSAFEPKGYLHNEALVGHLTYTLCPPISLLQRVSS